VTVSGVVFSQSSLRSHWITELLREIGSTLAHEQDDAMNLDLKMKLGEGAWKCTHAGSMVP
jgi:hypothetical protein